MTKNALTILAALAAFSFAGCDDPAPAEDPTDPTTVEGEGEGEGEGAEQVEPMDLTVMASRIGGLRMAVGQFGVELRPQASGVIKALVSDGTGAVVEGADIEVSMLGADGGTHDVALSWDASASAYLGTMEGTTPAAGAAKVRVTANEATAEAEVPSVAVAATPVYGGQVVLFNDVAAEVRPEADGVVYVTAQGPDGYLGADADIELSVNATATGGDSVNFPLSWDEPSHAFVGVLAEGTTLAPGALELRAKLGDVEYTSGLEVGVAAPAHDGDVVAVGDLSVELVPAPDGVLTAYVTDPSGAAVAAGADVSIEVEGADAPVALAWDDAEGVYKGEIAADVDVSTAPLVVAVNHGGKARRGGIAVAAGRALGVGWRSRVESGAGGAIPPGQQMRLASNVEVRGRVGASAVAQAPTAGADVEVGVSAMGEQGRARAEVAMTRGAAQAEAARARGAAANARGQVNQAEAQGQAAHRAAVMVQAPRPPSAMVNAGASAMGGAMGGSAMGGASVMIGF